MRIGVESGYIKEADIGVPPMMILLSSMKDMVAKIDAMGADELRHPKLEEAATIINGNLARFDKLLDTYGS
jgi:hypothetical protein